MFGTGFHSVHLVVLPQAENPRAVPRLRDYITDYFTSAGKPAPKMLDGVERGYLHAGSKVDLLFVAMSFETWWLISEWVKNNTTNAVIQSEKVRVYGDRVSRSQVLYTEQIRGKTYIALLSTPYESKDYVKQFTESLWQAHVPVLYEEPQPEPSPEPEPPAAPKQFPPLPTPPKPFTPRRNTQ